MFPPFIHDAGMETHRIIIRNINTLRFNLRCKDNTDRLYTICVDTLRLIKSHHVEGDDAHIYLKSMIELIVYCRDYKYGLGQYTTYYALIFALYNVYPTIAIYVVRNMMPVCNTAHDVGGSWKDIKLLCDHIRTHFANESCPREDHPFIDTCIEMMNAQLVKDSKTVNRDIFAISNVAKWIPRENKKYGWLHEKMVFAWAVIYASHILASANDDVKYELAYNKCRGMYRKMCSYLNRCIDTPEINHCDQTADQIAPRTIPRTSLYKHMHNGYKSYNDRLTLDLITPPRVYAQSKYSIYNMLTINEMIKNACYLYENREAEPDSVNIKWLNHQWNKFIEYMKKHHRPKGEYIMPILDVSFDMKTHLRDFHSAIGIALTFAQLGHMRIMAVGHKTCWIELHDSGFVQNVFSIMEQIKPIQNTSFNVAGLYNTMNETLLLSESTTRFIRHMHAVVLSCFAMNEYTYDLRNSFTTKCLPNMIFWNTSSHIMHDLTSNLSERCIFTCGDTPSVISHIYEEIVYFAKYEKYTDMLCPENDVIGEYLNNVMA